MDDQIQIIKLLFSYLHGFLDENDLRELEAWAALRLENQLIIDDFKNKEWLNAELAALNEIEKRTDLNEIYKTITRKWPDTPFKCKS